MLFAIFVRIFGHDWYCFDPYLNYYIYVFFFYCFLPSVLCEGNLDCGSRSTVNVWDIKDISNSNGVWMYSKKKYLLVSCWFFFLMIELNWWVMRVMILWLPILDLISGAFCSSSLLLRMWPLLEGENFYSLYRLTILILLFRGLYTQEMILFLNQLDLMGVWVCFPILLFIFLFW